MRISLQVLLQKLKTDGTAFRITFYSFQL